MDSSTYRQLRDHIIKAALDELRAVVHQRRVRQSRCAELHPTRGSAASARALVTECLWDWGHVDTIRPAQVVASELINNVVAHTDSAPVLRVEADGAAITIAVSDHSRRPPALIETTSERFRLSGLRVVAALADAWGYVPSMEGKTVWATITSPN